MAKKQQCRVRNWSNYNKSVVNRGSLTLWFDEESIKNWHQVNSSGHRGRPQFYADIAINCMLTIKMVFKFPLRATQGLVNSLISLLNLPIQSADYSAVAHRQKKPFKAGITNTCLVS